MGTITVRQSTPDDAPELAVMLDRFDGIGAIPEQVATRMLTCQSVLTTFLGEMDAWPQGADPAHTEEARRKLGVTAAENARTNAEWELQVNAEALGINFKRDSLPSIQSTPSSGIMDVTGLSFQYYSLI